MNTQTHAITEPTLLNVSLIIIVSLILGVLVGINRDNQGLKEPVESNDDNYSI